MNEDNDFEEDSMGSVLMYADLIAKKLGIRHGCIVQVSSQLEEEECTPIPITCTHLFATRRKENW